MTRVLVTGASGFVGRALCMTLAAEGYRVRAVLRESAPRRASLQELGVTELVRMGEIGPDTDWTSGIEDVDAVVHLAARLHVMRETVGNSLAEFRRVNVEGTRSLARAAAEAGVRRLVFLSTLKVNGESSGEQGLSESDPPRPADPYAVSKWEAEQALHEIAGRTGLEAVILRPPLVYGPGVKDNFLRLMDWVARGVPLPLASIRNSRSLLYLDNLVAAIEACLREPSAAGETFLLKDGGDLSTPELIRQLARAMGGRARLLPFPVPLLALLGAAAGQSAAVTKLTGSLVVEDAKIRRVLGWRPPVSLERGLANTAGWYNAATSATSRL